MWFIFLSVFFLASCGGGGGGDPDPANPTPPPPPPNTGGNNTPLASVLLAATEVETAIQIDLNDLTSDPDGDPLSYSLPQTTSNLGGSIVIVNERLSQQPRVVTLTPAPGFTGMTDTVNYTVTDNKGASASNTIYVTLNAKTVGQLDLNLFQTSVDPILASCIDCHEAPNGSGNFDIHYRPLLGSTEMSTNYNEARKHTDINDPAGSVLLQKATGNGHGGGAVINANGQQYSDILNWIQNPVQPPAPPPPPPIPGGNNNPPLAAALVTATEAETAIQIDLMDLTSDPDGDPLTYSLPQTTSNLGGSLVIVNERLSQQPRVVTLTPAAGITGMTDTFSYTVTDSKGVSTSNTISVAINSKTAGQLELNLYQTTVDPILASLCVDCHEAPNGNGNFDIHYRPLLGSTEMSTNYTEARKHTNVNDAGSTLLRKATGNGHGGGAVINTNSQQYIDILNWIRSPVQ